MQDTLVIALVRERYFGGAHLVDWVRSVGYKYKRVDTCQALIKTLHSTRPALVIVDLEYCAGDLGEIVQCAGSATLLAFGSPRDAQSRLAAKSAGFHEVLINNEYHRCVAELLARHLPAETIRVTENGEVRNWRTLWSRIRR